MKWVKFGVSRHFLENPLRKWPGICMLMYLEHLQNWVDYGHSLLIFPILALFWVREMVQIWGFWSCSVDFPHDGAHLTETGHIWGFWPLSGEFVGVNVEGGAEAYFWRFASSSVWLSAEFICRKAKIYKCIFYWSLDMAECHCVGWLQVHV